MKTDQVLRRIENALDQKVFYWFAGIVMSVISAVIFIYLQDHQQMEDTLHEIKLQIIQLKLYLEKSSQNHHYHHWLVSCWTLVR